MVASLAELASLDTHRVYAIVNSPASASWELRHVGRDTAPISTCTVWSVRMLEVKLADYLQAAYATGGAVAVTRRLEGVDLVFVLLREVARFGFSFFAGCIIGLALDRYATLPDLERFYIGILLASSFGLWIVALLGRAWLEERRRGTAA